MAKSIFVIPLVLLAIYMSAHASHESPMFCDYGQFYCEAMNSDANDTCISFEAVCDGVNNCYNGSDESFCGDCPTGSIECPLANTTVCISNSVACDGTPDCPNGEDETVNACGCIDPDQLPVCVDSNEMRYCINESRLCDGVQDCTYGEDESFPYCPESCPPELSCFGDGTFCFEVYQLCDGVFNCENAFDEGNCSTPEPESPFCPYGMFICPDGIGGRSCLNYTQVCDGIYDCYNGTDESLCGNCSTGSILCPNSSVCIENTLACNGIEDCPDGCDESVGACGCLNEGEVPICTDEYGNLYCLNETRVCDGVQDCTNGEDESFPYCPEIIVCGPNELTCPDNNTCVNIIDVCSGYIKCGDIFEKFCNGTTTPPTPSFCPYGTYNCDRGGCSLGDSCCLNYTSVCDGVQDCLSYTDEMEDICGNCSLGMIQCPNSSMCINNTLVCDGYDHCPYGADESIGVCGCPDEGFYPVCSGPSGEPYCLNGSLICDGTPDCMYGEDESELYNCPTTPPPTPGPMRCPYGYFGCSSDYQCAPTSYLCDGVEQCEGGFDEYLCGNCSLGQIMCFNSSMCINATDVCNGIYNCPSACDAGYDCPSDIDEGSICYEASPPTTTEVPTGPTRCPYGYFGCSSDYQCAPTSYLCDGIEQCEGGFDEYLCGNCSLGEFMCFNGSMCINATNVCDGIYDCPSDSDEGSICYEASPPTTTEVPTGPTRCPYGYFGCPPNYQCAPTSYLCDGIEQCEGGFDEYLCGNCSLGEFMCFNGSMCINATNVCDGIYDCPSDSDEGSICYEASPPTTEVPTRPPRCQFGYFNCYVSADISSCLPNFLLCDGNEDCFDGSDELPCGGNCTVNEYLCPGTSDYCVNTSYVCDDIYHCPNGTDEHQICYIPVIPTEVPTGPPRCQFGFFNCYVSENISSCLPNTYLCDGQEDCFDGSDEVPCGGNCTVNEYLCPGTEDYCIDNAYVCDDIYHCPNGTDEHQICYIPEPPEVECPPGSIPCGFDFTNCFTPMEACDGFNDCGDELAIDEIAGFITLGGLSCPVVTDGDELVIGLLAPLFNGTVIVSEGASVFFCIVRGGLSSRDPFNVTLTSVGTGAVPDVDFTDVSGTTNFSPDDTIACFNLSIEADGVIENNEGFYISAYIEADVNYTTVGPTTVDFEILDFDGASIDVEPAVNVTEGDYVDICVTVADLGNGLERNVTFDVVTFSNTTDFYLDTFYITITEGSYVNETICFTVGHTVDDLFFEDPETVLLYLSPRNFVDQITNAIIEVTIFDNDYVEFEFEQPTYIQVDEGQFQLTICVVPTTNLTELYQRASPIFVNFAVIGVTATRDEDFAYSEGTGYHYVSQFSNTDICLLLDGLEDKYIEDSEYLFVIVNISSPDSLVGPQQVDITILDNDVAEFETNFPPAIYTNESDWSDLDPMDAFQFCVTPYPMTQENLRRNVTIFFNILTVNEAEPELDFVTYGFGERTYYYDDNSSVCATVEILDDAVIEYMAELFAVSVYLGNANDTLDGNTTTNITILDDDFIYVSLMAPEYVPEDVGTFNLYVILTDAQDGLDRDVTVTINLQEYSPLELRRKRNIFPQNEFEPLGEQNVTFYAGAQTEANESITINVLDEPYIEGNETLIADIVLTGEPYRVVGEGTVYTTVVDNDGVTLFLSTDNVMILESVGEVSVTVYIMTTATRYRDVVVDVDIVLVTADANDIGSYTSQLVFGPDDNFLVLTVPITIDNVVGNSEVFDIVFTPQNPLDSFLNGTNVTVTVDESAMVGFTQAYIDTMEGAGNIEVCVYHANHTLETDLNVELRLVDDTAVFGLDYAFPDVDSSTYILTFPAQTTMTRVCVNVSIIDDEATETPEYFTITLTPVDSSDTVGIDTVTVTIFDNDGVTFEGENIQVNESYAGDDQIVPLCVTMTPSEDGLDRNATISYDSQILTFGPTQVPETQCFNYTVIGDDLVENTEFVSVIFTTDYDLDTANRPVVTIYDDDGATISFALNNVTVDESVGEVEVCIVLEDVQGGLVRTVPFTVTYGDGIRMPGAFRLSNETYYCFNTTIINDSIIEDSEEITFYLTADNQNDYVRVDTFIIIVNDNDGATISFYPDAVTVDESEGEVEVCVILEDIQGGLSRDVPFTVTYGSEMETQNVFLSQSEVETSLCFNFTITDDDIIEDPEEITFYLTADNENDYVGVDTFIITVNDNDGANITLMELAMVTETDMDFVVQITITVEGMIQRNVTFDVAVVDETSDVFILDGRLTVEQNGTYFVELIVVGDNIVEYTEQFSINVTAVNEYDTVGEPIVLTVEDDDGAVISIEALDTLTEEDVDVIVPVIVTVEGMIERDVTFTVAVGAEYIDEVFITGGELTVSQSGMYYVNLTVVGDNVIEATEQYGTIGVTVVNPLDQVGETTTVTVVDDDTAVIAIIPDFGSSISENVIVLQICAELNDTGEGLERSVEVIIGRQTDEPAGPVSPEQTSISFPSGSIVGTSMCVNFSRENDDYVESDGLIIFAFTSPLDGLSTDSFEVSVVDDDGVTMQLEYIERYLLEGSEEYSTTTVCLFLTSDPGLIRRTVQARAEVIEYTDNVNLDTFSHTMTADVTDDGRACFSLYIEDDNEYLPDARTIELAFTLTYLTDVIEGPHIVTVTIDDDDSPLVEFKDYVPFIDVSAQSDGVLPFELGPTDDGCSSSIFMNSGLPFGSTSETSLRVCANGAISVGTAHFNFFSPSRFPGFFPVSDTNVIAPFWNDHDPSGPSSNVWYKIYSANFGGAARQYLEDVSNYTRCNSDATTFNGNWMLVVEWNTVPPFPIRFDTEIVNTYQAIVITDGVLTFALYTYKCGELRWTAGPASSTHSVIGFNIGPQNRRFESTVEPFFNHPFSGFPDISRVACMNEPNRIQFSNLLYLVGNDSGADQLAIAQCVKERDRDIAVFSGRTTYSEPCPCSASQAFRDFNYFYASFFLYFVTDDESFFNRDCFLPQFPPFSSSDGVQLCCYSTRFFDRGALLDSSFGMEGSSLLRFHPAYNPDEYLEYDYRFKQSCCESAGVCEFYTQVRPSDNCFFYRPPRRAWCWGDPHITTLDGGSFTFNGWGEYTLLDFTLDPTSFLLQGRTSPVNGSTATQLVAFAFAMIRAQPVEIGIKSNDSNEMYVLFNQTDVSANVTNVNDTYTIPTLTLTRTGENSLMASFPNRVGVTVTASFAMLSFVLIVPERFRNITVGMMGNYNGDPMDDVRFRNGTMLLANVSDRTIHEVGQSWEISPEDSLFTYPEGMGPSDYSFPDHLPVFLDEVVANASDEEVLKACGDDAQCIFDASQTGNIDIGLETMNTNEQNEDDQNQATNNPPRIMGPNTLRLDLGVEATLVMNVSDDKNMFNFTVVDGLPPGAMLTPVVMDGFTEYTFTWTVNEVMNRSLMFEASDELDARSVLNVQVQVCACENNGTCTIEGIVGTSADFIVLNCECNEAYMGRFCENDVDGCLEFMCFQGVECNDVPAPGVGATCGPCPDGYVGDGEKCDDFNECVNGTHGCSDICNNLEGSFECLCPNGYELLNATHCQDIDECAMLNGGCHQECTNSDGTFTCTCFNGYELSDDNRTCNVLANATCSNETSCTQNCVRLFGDETCSCNRGYELDTDNQTCINVNECLTSNPCQVCTDTDGSFECSCVDGYSLLSDNETCEAINECVEAALNNTMLCTPPMFCVDLPPDMGKFRCDCPGGTDLIDGMCIAITTPPPTTMPPPTGTVPEDFRDDAVIITIPGLTVAEFGPEVRLQFREAAAEAINTFCTVNPADCNPTRKRQSFMNITQADIVMNNVRDVDGVLTFDMYVLTDMNAAIPATAVETAVEDNPEVFTSAGLTAPQVEPLVQPSTVPPVEPIPGLTDGQIIGIAVGCVAGAVLLLFIVVVLIYCCLRSRSKRGSHNFVGASYGLEYDNPVADDGDIEPITLKNVDDDDIPQASAAEPNIYVNPHGDEEEAEPKPKEMTEAKGMDAGEEKRSEDRSIQSLILQFGDDATSEHSVEKEELTSL